MTFAFLEEKHTVATDGRNILEPDTVAQNGQNVSDPQVLEKTVSAMP